MEQAKAKPIAIELADVPGLRESLPDGQRAATHAAWLLTQALLPFPAPGEWRVETKPRRAWLLGEQELLRVEATVSPASPSVPHANVRISLNRRPLGEGWGIRLDLSRIHSDHFGGGFEAEWRFRPPESSGADEFKLAGEFYVGTELDPVYRVEDDEEFARAVAVKVGWAIEDVPEP